MCGWKGVVLCISWVAFGCHVGIKVLCVLCLHCFFGFF